MSNKIKGSKIKYSDLYGLREEKYDFLESHNIKNTKWQDLEAKEPHYFFVPKDFGAKEKYNNFIAVIDIFEKYNAGIATGKDKVLVDFIKQDLITKLSVRDKGLFEITMQNYKVKKDLIEKWYEELETDDIEEKIKKYDYRPFDSRFTIYNSKILQRARMDIMDNFLFDNLGLCLSKQLSTEFFQHSFITNSLIDRCYISLATREVIYVFPLYLYQQQKTEPVFNGQRKLDLAGSQSKLDEQKKNKISNIKKEILELLKIRYKKTVRPEEIFNYIYAILYSNKYRKKYQEFLKIDFPRVPFTSDHKLFKDLGKIGKELINLHLLKSKELNKTVAKFQGIGLNEVRKREYDQKEKRLYINDKQYFSGIEPEIWQYYIGGYQVLDKWIKDRVGRNLSREEVEHYLKVIVSIEHTIKIQKEIDKLYPKTEKNL